MIGRHISHFYVIRTLGAGGMGVVYEAQDTRLPRSVAIKVLRDDLARNVDALKRFKREARLASSLNHPNICTVLEVSDDEAPAFIAMELLEGVSLKSKLLGGPLAVDEIIAIARQVADALAAAHDRSIIHRDITPGNIFLSAGGVVKLLDFGLAKHFPAGAADGQTSDDLTHAGVVPGTIHYMSPEQLALDEPVDFRCDFFALGAVLYQMVTGARPFDLPSRSALSAAIQSQPHVPLRALAPHHPVQLERMVDRLLAKRPEGRYQSARALSADLDALKRSLAIGARVALPGVTKRSLAVLPFDIVGEDDATTVTFRDGLAADVGSLLSQLPDVWVAPRTSTAAMRGQSASVLGARLGVSALLEGTVQHCAGRVRVTATLVDAATDQPVLPSVIVQCAVEDTLDAQAVIAREISGRLASVLSAAPVPRAGVREPEAYHAYKRGQHLWKSCFEGGWRSAIEQFQHAIERDPQFVPAHLALASAYNFLGFYALMKPNLAFAVAARTAERALAIDSTLAAAHLETALAKLGGEWDWDGSEQAFRRSLALDPTNALTHVHYSWLLVLLGREAAAFTEAERSKALAPRSRFVATACAQTMYLAGQYDDAIALCSDCLRFDAEYVFAFHVRGLCHLARGARDAAVADLERAAALGGRSPFYLGILGLCYGQFGMREAAMRLASELAGGSPDRYVPPQSYVFIYAGLGERERALAYQEKAYADGASPFNYLTPAIRALYARSPQHKERLQQMRLVV